MSSDLTSNLESVMEEISIDNSPSSSISDLSTNSGIEIKSDICHGSNETLTYSSPRRSPLSSSDELRMNDSRSPSTTSSKSDEFSAGSRKISKDRSTPELRKQSVVLLLDTIYETRPHSTENTTDSSSIPSTIHSWKKIPRSSLEKMSLEEIKKLMRNLNEEKEAYHEKLMRNTRHCYRLRQKVQARCAILTAILQAHSAKRSEDTLLVFTLTPMGEMDRWITAMKAMIRLGHGLPSILRIRLWLTLAQEKLDTSTQSLLYHSLSDRLLDGDEMINIQILKDLHRTGLEGFEQVKKLKQVLLAYARYNKDVGYCQGFNVIVALILQVMEYDTYKALKVMVFLVDYVLPEGYFDQSLGALTVDLAVVKDLLKIKVPNVYKHIEMLQLTSENEYEPPLLNYFSVHWLLTLYSTCFPHEMVFRIWDALILEGKIQNTKTTEEFYVLSVNLMKRMSTLSPCEQNSLINYMYKMAEFPFPGVVELRDEHTFNIQPLANDEDPELHKCSRRGSKAIAFDEEKSKCCCCFKMFEGGFSRRKRITDAVERRGDVVKRSFTIFPIRLPRLN